jgi:hypothetical protein
MRPCDSAAQPTCVPAASGKPPASLFYVAADETTYDMMQRYAGLSPNKVDDKSAVRAALGRLLRALNALLELDALRRR